MKRRAQLQATPLAKAQRIFSEALESAGFFQAPEEDIQTTAAWGRVTSRAVLAVRNVPHFASAAMDGIAVQAERTASHERPLRLRRGLDFEYVDTGGEIPEKFNAVVKIEDVLEIDSETVEIAKPAMPGKDIRAVGEDFSPNAQVVPANFQLTPEAIAALLNTGNLTVCVKRQLKVIFIPTGSELVSFEQEPATGQFPETNSQIVKGYVERWDSALAVHPIVPNDEEHLRRTLQRATTNYDLILVGSGTSKGRGDFVADVVAELGQVLVHGVAYHPGHPVLLGMLKGAKLKPVIGLPGYPVATWLALWLFVKPFLEKYYYGTPRELPKVKGLLTETVKSVLGYREFVRAKLERRADGSYLVHQLRGGASKLSTIVGADGWVEVPEDVSELRDGAEVEAVLLPR